MNRSAVTVNWILLGLVMLVPGLLKLFVTGLAAIVGMLSGTPLFAWAPTFWAWVLILAEILSGILILAKWKVEKVIWFPIIILVVATFTAHWANWGNMLVHLALASNYWLLPGLLKSGK
ncbi:MAG: DoxX family membrane protein [Nanoarchaeota archaeon]|nr:DoxX family membrane protein [Nanoarchaeota archaeon]